MTSPVSDLRPDVPHDRIHGDQELQPGMIDLATNVRRPEPPAWLVERLVAAIRGSARYPQPRAATDAIAHAYRLNPAQVLVTSGAAEAFTLMARALKGLPGVNRAVVVHPQFSEPERALRAAGWRVDHVLASVDDGFALPRAQLQDVADSVVLVGNPTNPTSVLHSRDDLVDLAARAKYVCVDEAFLDTIPHEPQSLLTRDLPNNVVVVRSLTKVWALAGVRIGFIAAAEPLIALMAAQQPQWSVNSLALVAAQACVEPVALQESTRAAESGMMDAAYVVSALRAAQIVSTRIVYIQTPQAPFVLMKIDGGEDARMRMRERGWAIRSGASFPGLSDDWWRLAARAPEVTQAFMRDLVEIVTDGDHATVDLTTPSVAVGA